MKIIAITGTKGKTTITRVVDHALLDTGIRTLRVDNDGHWVNGKKRSAKKDSFELFLEGATLCPGKYLLDMRKFYPDFSAILEASVGCRGEGLGYRNHDVGVFANVFKDHLNPRKKLSTQEDLAEAKSFIFKRIRDGGWAVFNADDENVCGQIAKIPSKRAIRRIAVGIGFDYCDVEALLEEGGCAIALEGDDVVLRSKGFSRSLLNVRHISWTFEGRYLPSIYNLMLSLAAIYAHGGGNIGKEEIASLKTFRFEPEGGRLVRLSSRSGAKILIDYAHEQYSLVEVAKLARDMAEGKVIGVLRLSPGRSDQTIRETASAIAPYYDEVFIYDKIDGTKRKEYVERDSGFSRKAGETAAIFAEALKSAGHDSVHVSSCEKDAIDRSAAVTEDKDCVVIIRGDDPVSTYAWTRESYGADS